MSCVLLVITPSTIVFTVLSLTSIVVVHVYENKAGALLMGISNHFLIGISSAMSRVKRNAIIIICRPLLREEIASQAICMTQYHPSTLQAG